MEFSKEESKALYFLVRQRIDFLEERIANCKKSNTDNMKAIVEDYQKQLAVCNQLREKLE